MPNYGGFIPGIRPAHLQHLPLVGGTSVLIVVGADYEGLIPGRIRG